MMQDPVDLSFIDDMVASRLPCTQGRLLLRECAAGLPTGGVPAPCVELTPSSFAATLGVRFTGPTLSLDQPSSAKPTGERNLRCKALARVLESPLAADVSGKPDPALLITAANELLWAFTSGNDVRYLDWAVKVVLVAIGNTPTSGLPAFEARVLCKVLARSLDLLNDYRVRLPRPLPPAQDDFRTRYRAGTGPATAPGRPLIVITGPNSGTAKRLLSALTAMELQPLAVVTDPRGYPRKCYPVGDGAWYPPDASPGSNCNEPSVHWPEFQRVTLDDVAALTKSGARLGVLAGCGRLPSAILDRFPDGVLNAHNGSLPDVRGMDAVAWSTLKGIAPAATLHYAVNRIDAGRVIAEVPMGQRPTKAEFKEVMVGLLADAVARYCAGYDLEARPIAHGTGPLHFPMNPLFRAILTEEAALCKP